MAFQRWKQYLTKQYSLALSDPHLKNNPPLQPPPGAEEAVSYPSWVLGLTEVLSSHPTPVPFWIL